MSYAADPARALSAARLRVSSLAQCLHIRTVARRGYSFGSLIVLTVCTVAWAPRFAGAQATTGASVTVRHTISAQVGTITKATLGAPRRPDAVELGKISGMQSQAQAMNAWASTAALSSNVPGVLILESASLAAAANNGSENATLGSASGVSAPDGNNSEREWLVVNAAGQLVPWSGEPITVSSQFAAGRHEIVIILVAPDGETAPPSLSARVLPI